jgi:hypothetical protein
MTRYILGCIRIVNQTCSKLLQMYLILYIKVTMYVCVGSAWKILPVTARSLWSVLGGGGREIPVKHGAGGPTRAGEGGGTGGGELDGCIMHRVHTN